MQDEQDPEPLLSNQQNQLGLLFSEGDSIDGKALALLGTNIAAITFIKQAAGHVMGWELLALYVPFVVSLVLNVYSIWPRPYKAAGVDPDELTDYVNMSRDELLLQLLSNTQSAILHNAGLNRQRMRACLISLGITGLGFLLVLFIL
jgi:hypothetical protein